MLALVLKETEGQPLRHLLLLGHSAGATLALRCAAALEDEPNCHVQSIVLCGAAALPPLPSTALFRLPLCALELLKPLLDSGFEQLALHPATREANGELLAKARATNEANVMHMCRAYYRQLRLPTADEPRARAAAGRCCCSTARRTASCRPSARRRCRRRSARPARAASGTCCRARRTR